jgi:membrane-bound inhibitor of C-type lysozyme
MIGKKTILAIVIIVVLAALAAGEYIYKTRRGKLAEQETGGQTLVGGDRDSHGCIPSAGYQWCPARQECVRPWEESCGIAADFACADGKSISATFKPQPDDEVTFTLSDGRQFTLPHAISADGARYANKDQSVVFWNKGNTAFLQEGGVSTYHDCVTGQP